MLRDASFLHNIPNLESYKLHRLFTAFCRFHSAQPRFGHRFPTYAVSQISGRKSFWKFWHGDVSCFASHARHSYREHANSDASIKISRTKSNQTNFTKSRRNMLGKQRSVTRDI